MSDGLFSYQIAILFSNLLNYKKLADELKLYAAAPIILSKPIFLSYDAITTYFNWLLLMLAFIFLQFIQAETYSHKQLKIKHFVIFISLIIRKTYGGKTREHER